MSRSANVLSVQTLKDFKVTMINFAEEARNSLSGVDMELRRMRDWLERDQLGYWQAQVKRRSEELMQARSDLHRRKISQQGSDAVSDADQKEALREATRRLRVAEEKVALVKKLIPMLHHAIAGNRLRRMKVNNWSRIRTFTAVSLGLAQTKWTSYFLQRPVKRLEYRGFLKMPQVVH